MPKTRHAPKSRGAKAISKRVKFKLGGRKSVRSAQYLSIEELAEEFVKTGTRGRDQDKIRKMLQKRGVSDETLKRIRHTDGELDLSGIVRG